MSKLIVSFRGQQVEMQLQPGVSVKDVKARVVFAADPALCLTPSDIKLIHDGKILNDDQQDMLTLLVGGKNPVKTFSIMATGMSLSEARASNHEFLMDGIEKVSPFLETEKKFNVSDVIFRAAISEDLRKPSKGGADIVLAKRNYEAFHSLPKGSATNGMLIWSSAGIAGWESCKIEEPQKWREDPQDEETEVLIMTAKQNYENFHSLSPGSATLEMLENSVAGIAGWAKKAAAAYRPMAPYRTMAPPTDVLEESRSTQDLFKRTAGNRPPQPEEDRAYFEMLWRQNFAMSQVDYQVPKEVLTAGTPISSSAFADSHFSGDSRELSNYGNLATDYMAMDAEVAEAIERLHGGREGPQRIPHEVVNRQVRGTGRNKDLTVLIRGDNVFGTTVSKSFDRVNRIGNREVDTVNITIASYRVVESKKDGKYAQFLVIYREGSIRDTIGVWKRYFDFEELSHKLTQSHDSCTSVLANISPLAITEEQDVEHLPNAITSWHLLKKRKRWYRCLDAGYLSLKVFLLERFLHDILIESSSPNLLRDFVIYDNSTK